MARDDDRPKKSWRDLDRQRDRPDQRRDAPRGERPKRHDASKSHRQALDRLFSTGKISELVAQRDAETGAESSGDAASRRKLTQAVMEASDRDGLVKAIEAYIAAFPNFPHDFDVLTRFLEHGEPEVVKPTMDRLEAMLQQEKPRRARTLIAQLRTIGDLSEYGSLRKRAEALLELL